MIKSLAWARVSGNSMKTREEYSLSNSNSTVHADGNSCWGREFQSSAFTLSESGWLPSSLFSVKESTNQHLCWSRTCRWRAQAGCASESGNAAWSALCRTGSPLALRHARFYYRQVVCRRLGNAAGNKTNTQKSVAFL